MSTEKFSCKPVTVKVSKIANLGLEDLRSSERLAQRLKDLERPVQQYRKSKDNPVYLVATNKLVHH